MPPARPIAAAGDPPYLLEQLGLVAMFTVGCSAEHKSARSLPSRLAASDRRGDCPSAYGRRPSAPAFSSTTSPSFYWLYGTNV